jgi:adenosylcobinamide kinase / adenosylcobinamide-phosphate guanylyltransferase
MSLEPGAINETILLLGGARSGKSRRALALAEAAADTAAISPVFIATAESRDAEMAARIAAHRHERGPRWRTVEAPLAICGALTRHRGEVCVVDCLTLWLSNLMFAGDDVVDATTALAEAVGNHGARLVLVSNEVGLGLVPETALGRAFRDAQGRLNQHMATVCDRVEFLAAGLPLTLKP